MADKNRIIRTRAPLRISFAGGGTDLNEVFEKYGGEVVNTTIDKYVYVELKKGKGIKINGKAPDDFTMQIIKRFKINNISINTWFEIPYGRGLANSSAYSIALAKAILIYKNSHRTKRELINYVYGIENSLGKCGWQDQFACCYGGLNYILFNKNKKKIISLDLPLKIKRELEKRLCLIYTGLTHNSSIIHKKKKPLNKKRINDLKKLVGAFLYSIFFNKIKNIAKILNKNWQLKKDKAITNKTIDKLYKLGFKYGATGGKLLGAGDGGYILFYVEPDKMFEFREKISKNYEILNVKFSEKGVEQW